MFLNLGASRISIWQTARDAAFRPSMKKQNQLQTFIQIIKKLRSPKGCPWDKKQTHHSLKQHLLEETYEVLDAIDKKDTEHLKEELGDLLLQVILHAQIATDLKEFTIEDVARNISEKIIRRHPHVFGNVRVRGSSDVLKNWEKIKDTEKEKKGFQPTSILDSIPKGFPALLENLKISKKAAHVGFDWKKPADVFDKVDEELKELKQAIKKKDKKNIAEELGDVLFSVSNLCRLYGANPELALHASNKKFRKRFAKLEGMAQKKNVALNKLSFEEWNRLYEKSK